jgi:hypothetical protein
VSKRYEMREVTNERMGYRQDNCISALILNLVLLATAAYGNETISVEARPNAGEIFLNPGTIRVNYTLPVMFARSGTDGGGPGGAGPGFLTNHGLQIVVTAGDETLANYQVNYPSIAQDATVLNDGTFSFYNPIAQMVAISGSGTYVRNLKNEESIYPQFQEWTVENGQTMFVGGTTSDGSSAVAPPLKTTGPNLPPEGRSNIHAIIISALSDPAKVIASPNVTLTGGIIALGKNPTSPATPSTWSPGLQIVPDYGLLTGEKIPPVTPNLIDVRIVRQEVTADFPSPNPQPSK